MPATPFTDPDLVAGPLYATVGRLAQRTGALHAAKTSGEDATTTIGELAAQFAPDAAVVCDIGCGRGTTTIRLARRLQPARLIAVDQSPALLDTVAERMADAGHAVETVCADFHRLPLPQASLDIAVAAFCLYHSPHPERAVAEIARCLTPGGRAVLVTKSANSYFEIDQLIADEGRVLAEVLTPLGAALVEAAANQLVACGYEEVVAYGDRPFDRDDSDEDGNLDDSFLAAAAAGVRRPERRVAPGDGSCRQRPRGRPACRTGTAGPVQRWKLPCT